MFTGKSKVRKVQLDGKYSVSDDGLVWSGDLPLEPIGGVGVNLHGKRVKICYLVPYTYSYHPMPILRFLHSVMDFRSLSLKHLRFPN